MARTVNVSGSKAAEATAGFPTIPAGKYIAKIVDVKEAKTEGKSNPVNKGLPVLVVRYKITESSNGEGVGRQFTDFQVPLFKEWNTGSTAFTFYTFFKALGVEFPKKGEDGDVELPENEDIAGEEIGLVLGVEQKFGAPKGETTNKVKNYFAASDGLPEPKETEDEFTL